jgi:GntR family transcriptional regulator
MADPVRAGFATQIDRHTPVPLYFQIAERLRQIIREQQMPPGTLLTTDDRVKREFRVSRATARKAIDELADEGLVERITGRGTFVTEPKLQVSLPIMLSFTEELRRRGIHPSTRVVSAEWASAGELAGRALGISASARALRLERVRFADGKPVLLSVDVLPEEIGIGTGEDFSGSLYQLIESRGVELAECQNIIQAAATDERLARMLGVEAGFPILALRRTSYDTNNRPVLYEEAFCRSDLYSYSVRLSRSADTSKGEK